MSDQPKCTTCSRVPKDSPYHECSHVECPNRKPVTAQPCDSLYRCGETTVDGDNWPEL